VRRLHRQLESYRLPKHLGAIEALNQRGAALGPIFRDRDDLSASDSLSDAITQALDAAQVLIIACSPSAKASRWVTQEIAYFKSRHPTRPVLAAILDGDPAHALPDALTHDGAEPMAADLRATRQGGDGWRLGFLKVVAGVAGVPLDTLVQRDSQRQMRRVMAVTGVVGVVALAMGVMTTLALQARSEAEFQRDQAEGFVAYMMGDLRRELRGVGRLDVMEGVNARALRYYAEQGDTASLRADSLEQRAAILHAQGEDLERAGKLEGAVTKFTEAHRDTGELLAREPDNSDRVFAHAQSEFWLGFAERGRDLEAQDRHWSAYLELAKTLETLEPDSSRSAMELGFTHGNMCELRLSQRRMDDALRFCRQSVTHMKQAIDRVEADTDREQAIESLANRHGWLADALLLDNRFDEALAERQAEAQLIDQLIASDPSNKRFQFRRTWPDIGTGDIQLAQGNAEAVPAAISAALSQLAKLNDHDPDNAEIALVRVRALLLMASAKRAARQDWGDDFGIVRTLTAQSSGQDFHSEMVEMTDEFENGVSEL